MLIREKFVIALGVVIIGVTSWDAAFTPEAPVVSEPVERLTNRPVHRMPQEAPQAPETTSPVSTLPAPVVSAREPLTHDEALERIEDLEVEVQDAMQAAEDGE